MSGLACSTAIRPSSRITRTPGSFSAALVSALFSRAPSAGGRTSRACSMPGRITSAEYFALPVTLSAALEGVVLRKRLLDGVQTTIPCQPFDGEHLFARDVLDPG